MEFITLDDLLHHTFDLLLNRSFTNHATRSKDLGPTSEVIGISLKLTNPHSRISRSETRGKPFSALGEFLWYFTGDNKLDFISYYIQKYNDESSDKEAVYGGYGPRLFNHRGQYDQLNKVIEILKSKPTTRRAVIQIYDAMDMFGDHKEIPCTCTLQFFVRDEKVHLVAHMRSNDVFLGLPHDIFSFTMIQEVVAKELNLGVGTYTHLVGSLHLYKNHKSQVKNYINEGYQSTEIYMPEMPADSPLKLIKQLLDIESDIRNETDVKNKIEKLPDYWADLARILEIHTFFKLKKRATNEQKKSEYLTKIIEVRDQFQHEEFKNYINTRL